MQGIKICGLGTYTPNFIASNKDFEKILDTSDEWITTRTGIKQRHISRGEPVWYMASNAAKQAIEQAGISPKEIDLILVSTTTPDYFFPSSACMVQREIGAEGCMALEFNCACSGFVYGVDLARRYLATGDVNTVLLIASEILTRLQDYQDRSTSILFGDGAAACIITKSDSLFSSYLGADGQGAKYLVSKNHFPVKIWGSDDAVEDGLPDTAPFHMFQDGKEVYKFATQILPFTVNKALEKVGLQASDIDFFIPHQANLRIIQTAASNLGVSMDRFYITLDRYGNTSSSSIPIALQEAVETGTIKRGQKVCLIGFGAGLTYGAVIFEF
jgi:3-oxoacyl-[acyl-carrier-protein] synthase-3